MIGPPPPMYFDMRRRFDVRRDDDRADDEQRDRAELHVGRQVVARAEQLHTGRTEAINP